MPAYLRILRAEWLYRAASIIFVVSVAGCLFWTEAVRPDSLQDDMAVIRERLLAPSFARISVDHTRELVRTIRPDGSWADVDYDDRDRAVWKTARHMNNIRDMAEAYVAPDSPLNGENAVRLAIMQALDYWYGRDFVNPNWWFNQIGVPRTLAPALLMIEDDLTPSRLKQGIRILDRAGLNMTGQNLVWVAQITAMRGLLQHDPVLVDSAFSRIADEIVISSGEGIQADYSFHQHGPLLYSHGYGAGFAADCSQLAAILSGTTFAFPSEKVELLSSLILDGHQWMTRGRYVDFGAKGREITRRNQTAIYLDGVAERMLEVSTGREEEFRHLRSRIKGNDAPPLTGNRHFWRSDFMIHRRPGYYVSARMFSDRLFDTDKLINNEGFLSHHLADGVTVFLLKGDEYHDIYPVWDWQKIPGTTVVQRSKELGEIGVMGSRPFAGGVSDGQNGMAVFDFEREGLEARKACVFFDDTVVCLGSGISDDSGDPVATTLNQCHLRGAVSVLTTDSPRPTTLPSGNRIIENLRWVHHDGIGYLFPKPAAVHIENEPRTGSWRRISHSYPDEPVIHEVFTSWIDHGTLPDGGSYAYIAVPDVTIQGLSDFDRRNHVTILANTASLQAAYHKGMRLTTVAFYDAGEIKVHEDLAVRVNTPCLLLLRETEGAPVVSVANPENERLTVTVTITTPGETIIQSFPLPGGLYGGMTLTKSMGN